MAGSANQTKIFEDTWRIKFLTEDCETITELADALSNASSDLRTMGAAGVTMENLGNDYFQLTTGDPAVAKRFAMQEAIWMEEDGQ